MNAKEEIKLPKKQSKALREILTLEDWGLIGNKTGWSKHTLLACLYGNIKIAFDKKQAFEMAKEIAIKKAQNIIKSLS